MAKKINPYIGAEYDPKYDAYYNPKTNEWIESACGDPDCEFCRNRPEKHVEPVKKSKKKRT